MSLLPVIILNAGYTVELDVPFLLSLSDKALPLLDTNIVFSAKPRR